MYIAILLLVVLSVLCMSSYVKSACAERTPCLNITITITQQEVLGLGL